MNDTRSRRSAGGRIDRRRFVAGATTSMASAWIGSAAVAAPAVLRTRAPNEKISMALIGYGDMGRNDLRTFLAFPELRMTAVCDVDAVNRAAGREAVNAKYGGKDCAVYNDYRELLAAHKDLDAVEVVTPDHTHAMISIAAMQAGKHVYCQKPMTHTVAEARRVAEVARQTKVATQLGVGTQAAECVRVIREWLDAGAIGGVRRVHIWSNRPFWPQGIDRPKETPPVPASLDWDRWLGPAPHRPYHPAYLPLVWRGWRDFGTGALGDMGCYALDVVFRVLGLDAPTRVEATGAGYAFKMWALPTMNAETYPQASMVRWRFPAAGATKPVSVFWYDGGLRPATPADLDEANPLANEGMCYEGEHGTILADFTGNNPRLFPAARRAAFRAPPPKLPRSIGHQAEWIRAIRGGERAGAHFEYAARATEALLLGNVALGLPGTSLTWDSAALKVSNKPEANRLLHYAYRRGWSLG